MREGERAAELALTEDEAQRAMAFFREEQNLVMGFLYGLFAALAGAGVWAGATIATGYQIGWLADTLFIEVHPPLDEEREKVVLMNVAKDLVNASWEKRPFNLNGRALKQAVEEQSGIPVAIASAR